LHGLPVLTWYPCLQRTGSYDPRFRPWYSAAASVPKAVIVIVDSSGSMQSGGKMQARGVLA
jgi:Mg-chelatase subunit ChlD